MNPYEPKPGEKMGPVVFETKNQFAGFRLHKQGWNFYKVVAWFQFDDTTKKYTSSTHFGFDNAKDCGYQTITELTNAYWPLREELVQKVGPTGTGEVTIPE